MRKLSLIALLIAAIAAPVAAQTPPPLPVPPVGPVVGQPQTPPPPPTTPPPGQRGGGRGQATTPPAPGRGGGGQATTPPPTALSLANWAGRGVFTPPAQNIRIELKISDLASGRSAVKAVSMLLADGHNGRIRSGNANGTLNVDGVARAGVDGRILLDLTIEYMPDRSTTTAILNESISVVVANGQATLVSRSADPATERSVTLEVTATIVK